MKRDLLGLVRGHEELAEVDAADRRLALRRIATEALGPEDVAAAVSELSDWIDGYGPLTPLMRDAAVTDILVNGPHEVWVERHGHLRQDETRFEDAQELADLIERLLGAAGARVDALRPIADARAHDGARVHVVLPPLSSVGPLVSIRKFPDRAFTLDDLVQRAFLTDAQEALLRDAVVERKTIAIGGGTGTGKTTLANALLGCVDGDERVVVIEETPELRPVCPHWVSLLTRPSNIEGRGEVDQNALLRAALRMRPDRIVVGEVRGPEALVALQAMSTGHEGSIVTVHARCAADVRERLVELALCADHAPGEDAIRARVARSIDVVVQVGRRAGRRKVLEVLGAG
ncbi:MAG: Flp pilus assembly complex ATPase component TadA [Actinomycetota bacterium]|nr:Flp pilus assembly complex ATPase component TadA [Actinomycetota bacterium]